MSVAFVNVQMSEKINLIYKHYIGHLVRTVNSPIFDRSPNFDRFSERCQFSKKRDYLD